MSHILSENVIEKYISSQKALSVRRIFCVGYSYNNYFIPHISVDIHLNISISILNITSLCSDQPLKACLSRLTDILSH